MKIGIVLHPYGERTPGGLSRLISEWTRAMILSDQSNEYVIFLKHKPAESAIFSGKCWQARILGGGMFWLDRLARHPKADVYLFNTPVLPLFFRPQRSVVIAADCAYLHFPARSIAERVRRRITRWHHARALRRADRIVAISEATREDVVRFFPCNPEKIKIIHPGFTNICALPEEPIDLPDHFFFFPGTIKERKNVFNVIRAYEKFMMIRPHSGFKLMLSGRGEGEYATLLKKYVAEHKREQDVRFVGYVSENQLSTMYRRARALVFPGLLEGFGFPVLEAMSCGLPVITSFATSLGEIAGSAALLVDPHSVDEIASAMGRIADDQRLRVELIARGYERAQEFSWEKASQELLKILGEVAFSP